MAILEKFANLFKLDIPDLISSIFSGYTKRKAENKYDDFMKTSAGEYLKNLPAGKKHLAEMAMYFFTGMFDQKFPESTALHKYVKTIISDSGSEVAKRMINGIHTDLQKIPLTAEKMIFANLLCELDGEALKNIVEKLYAMDVKERKVLIQEMEYLNPEKLRKIAEMNDDDFQKFSGIFQPQKSITKTLAEEADSLINFLEARKEKREGGKKS